MYTGRVETLPCSLRQYVYDDINLTQSYQFFAGTNEGYNEIWWYYCSANSNTIDKYVILTTLSVHGTTALWLVHTGWTAPCGQRQWLLAITDS
jgi:hypothetical protein